MGKIAIAIKRTKWERDLIRYGSPDDVQKIYTIQNNAFEHIYASHKRQKESIRLLQEAFPHARILFREELIHFNFSGYDCIISIGGDNHFVYVSQFAGSHTPMIGINSDPDTSLGALLYFRIHDFLKKANGIIDTNHMTIEDWTRIDCTISDPDGETITTMPAVSEISIHSAFPDHISRYLVRTNAGEWEEQKSSGLLLATGTGSTGWFRNCHWAHLQEDVVFPKNAPFFRFIARELRATKSYRYHLKKVEAGETMEVISEMDGEVAIDSHPESVFAFPPGYIARFRLCPQALRVARDILPPQL